MLSAAKVGFSDVQVKRIGLISCMKQAFLGLCQVSDAKKRSRSTKSRFACKELRRINQVGTEFKLS